MKVLLALICFVIAIVNAVFGYYLYNQGENIFYPKQAITAIEDKIRSTPINGVEVTPAHDEKPMNAAAEVEGRGEEEAPAETSAVQEKAVEKAPEEAVKESSNEAAKATPEAVTPETTSEAAPAATPEVTPEATPEAIPTEAVEEKPTAGASTPKSGPKFALISQAYAEETQTDEVKPSMTISPWFQAPDPPAAAPEYVTGWSGLMQVHNAVVCCTALLLGLAVCFVKGRGSASRWVFLINFLFWGVFAVATWFYHPVHTEVVITTFRLSIPEWYFMFALYALAALLSFLLYFNAFRSVESLKKKEPKSYSDKKAVPPSYSDESEE